MDSVRFGGVMSKDAITEKMGLSWLVHCVKDFGVDRKERLLEITKYTFWGQLYRFQGIYAAFLVIAVKIFDQSKVVISLNSFIVIVFFFSAWGLIYLWFHPWLRIENDGLLIRRLGLVNYKVKWIQLEMYKKIRTVSRYGLIGLDPRYVKLFIKNGIWVDNQVYLLSFMNNYDEFTGKLEERIDSEEIFTDPRY